MSDHPVRHRITFWVLVAFVALLFAVSLAALDMASKKTGCTPLAKSGLWVCSSPTAVPERTAR